ncbi:uncharacterized protein LODBEIA_P16820 [Lodderomyces beijingensis]|uniref:Mitochondrial import protein 1 n=1 Tax=Lodderomyces beijingensis TaxID=1775926 RepID=A0ABP0ZIJ6_9ASCO
MSSSYANQRQRNESGNASSQEPPAYTSTTSATVVETSIVFDGANSNSNHTPPEQRSQQQQQAVSQIVMDALSEENDLAVLESQLSADEVVTNSDIANTESLIDESRVLDAQEHGQRIRDPSPSSPLSSLSIWDIFKKSAINLVLPFINGMMLGFGEILAHEIGFHYKWHGAKIEPPRRAQQQQQQQQPQPQQPRRQAQAASRYL